MISKTIYFGDISSDFQLVIAKSSVPIVISELDFFVSSDVSLSSSSLWELVVVTLDDDGEVNLVKTRKVLDSKLKAMRPYRILTNKVTDKVFGVEINKLSGAPPTLTGAHITFRARERE